MPRGLGRERLSVRVRRRVPRGDIYKGGSTHIATGQRRRVKSTKSTKRKFNYKYSWKRSLNIRSSKYYEHRFRYKLRFESPPKPKTLYVDPGISPRLAILCLHEIEPRLVSKLKSCVTREKAGEDKTETTSHGTQSKSGKIKA